MLEILDHKNVLSKGAPVDPHVQAPFSIQQNFSQPTLVSYVFTNLKPDRGGREFTVTFAGSVMPSPVPYTSDTHNRRHMMTNEPSMSKSLDKKA